MAEKETEEGVRKGFKSVIPDIAAIIGGVVAGPIGLIGTKLVGDRIIERKERKAEAKRQEKLAKERAKQEKDLLAKQAKLTEDLQNDLIDQLKAQAKDSADAKPQGPELPKNFKDDFATSQHQETISDQLEEMIALGIVEAKDRRQAMLSEKRAGGIDSVQKQVDKVDDDAKGGGMFSKLGKMFGPLMKIFDPIMSLVKTILNWKSLLIAGVTILLTKFDVKKIVGGIIDAVQDVVAWFTLLFEDPVGALKNAWAGIENLGGWLHENAIKPIIDWAMTTFTLENLTKSLGILKDIGGWLHENAIKPIIDWAKTTFTLENLTKAWGIIKDFGDWFWNNALKPIIDWISTLFDFSTFEKSLESAFNVLTFMPNMVTKGLMKVSTWLLKLFGFDDAASKLAETESDFSFGKYIVKGLKSVMEWLEKIFDIDVGGIIKSIAPKWAKKWFDKKPKSVPAKKTETDWSKVVEETKDTEAVSTKHMSSWKSSKEGKEFMANFKDPKTGKVGNMSSGAQKRAWKAFQEQKTTGGGETVQAQTSVASGVQDGGDETAGPQLMPETWERRSKKLVDTLQVPEFKSKIKDFVSIMYNEHGIPVTIHSAVRGKAEQDALKKKGVSNAGFGKSLHNYGAAIDFHFADTGFEGPWELAGKVGKSLGMQWGGDWTSLKDKPHLQIDKTWQEASEKLPLAAALGGVLTAPRFVLAGEAGTEGFLPFDDRGIDVLAQGLLRPAITRALEMEQTTRNTAGMRTSGGGGQPVVINNVGAPKHTSVATSTTTAQFPTKVRNSDTLSTDVLR